MTTTTLSAIRDAIIATVEALTPAAMTDVPFRLAPKHESVRAFASAAGSASLRRFSVERSGDDSLPAFFDPDAKETTTTLRLSVAYPYGRSAYGDDESLDLEDIMRADAEQIRGAIFDPDSYVTGQSLADGTIHPPEIGDKVAFQTITVRVVYTSAL